MRRRLIRLQLFLLVAVTGLLIWRATSGPPTPDGLAVLTDIESGDLRYATFVLEQPTPLAIDAAGSIERVDGATPLAAYGWILNRHTREVVWRIAPGPVDAEQATLVEVADTVTLGPGTYDVYFTAMGNTRASRRRTGLDRVLKVRSHWQNDEDVWRIVVRPVALLPETQAYRIPDVDLDELGLRREELIWSSAPMRNRRTQSYLFEVSRAVPVHVYAVGEFCDQPCDFGWIEDTMTGERVWEMTYDNTQPAGGRRENRQYEGVLPLDAGIYRAAFDTDAGHAFKDWIANPPYDPTAWGLSLWTENAADMDAVTAFDPWNTRSAILQLTQVGNDAVRSKQFVVREPLRVIAYALGEISSGGSLYDYGWIENDEKQVRVWEMSRDHSQRAGGSEKNRLETVFLTLDPGKYTLYFQTDGSHAYGDWNDPPEHPDRWGVTLFAMDTPPDTSVLQVLEAAPMEVAAAQTPTADMPPVGTGVLLLNQTGLDNEREVEAAFELDAPTRLRIYAVGEISQSGRYDYGWIERTETSETVWEMTLQNTTHAGGDDRNRVFNEVVTLPEGQYTVYFKTDFSHAYGDFGEGPPTRPQDWGIVIERLEQE